MPDTVLARHERHETAACLILPQHHRRVVAAEIGVAVVMPHDEPSAAVRRARNEAFRHSAERVGRQHLPRLRRIVHLGLEDRAEVRVDPDNGRIGGIGDGMVGIHLAAVPFRHELALTIEPGRPPRRIPGLADKEAARAVGGEVEDGAEIGGFVGPLAAASRPAERVQQFSRGAEPLDPVALAAVHHDDVAGLWADVEPIGG